MSVPRKFSTARILGLCLGGLLLLALAVQGLEGLLPAPTPVEFPEDPDAPEEAAASSKPEVTREDDNTIVVHLGRRSRSRYHFGRGEDVDAVFACLEAGLDREFPESAPGDGAAEDASKRLPAEPREIVQKLQDECVSPARRRDPVGDTAGSR